MIQVTFRQRLLVFLLLSSGLLALLLLAADRSWQHIRDLQLRFSEAQLDSFRLADHVQQTVIRLNNQLLRFRLRGDPALWRSFQEESTELDAWLTRQSGLAGSGTEKELLIELNHGLERYGESARQMHDDVDHATPDPRLMTEVMEFERRGDQMLSLGLRLADAHRAAQSHFIADANRGLAQLRRLLIGLLAMLLFSGGWLGRRFYADLVAPLRLQLVESRAVAERNEKLASLGLLAAGVAHEIRNPLTAIRARLYTLKKRLTADSSEWKDSGVIDREIDRLERIVKDFLQFARPAEPRRERLDVGALIREVQTLVAETIEQKGITFSVAVPDPVAVVADPAQIKQVLLNLLQNAAEAIGTGGGRIQVTARRGRKTLGGQEQEVAIIEVADDGPGIPAEIQKRLFDPFFTTKDTGSGLGLAIAARIMDRHGGALQFQTQPGIGTRFGLVLPWTPGGETMPPQPDQPAPDPA